MLHINWNHENYGTIFTREIHPKKVYDQCSALSNCYAGKIKLMTNQGKH